MAMLDKVTTNIHCCGIEVAFAGVSVPSVITGWQPFYNETFLASNFQKAYASISKINFSEESVTTLAGTSFKQKVVFQFPATDKYRAERVALLHKIKFIKVHLDDRSIIVIGRNDIAQNALPGIKSKSDEHLCEIEVEVQSISPAGFTTITNAGPPTIIPLAMTPYYNVCTYISGTQRFDLGKAVIPMAVVLNEGRVLRKEVEWTISGNWLEISYDSLIENDTIYISGFEGELPETAEIAGAFSEEFANEFE
jgi:hypothetical protein